MKATTSHGKTAAITTTTIVHREGSKRTITWTLPETVGIFSLKNAVKTLSQYTQPDWKNASTFAVMRGENPRECKNERQ